MKYMGIDYGAKNVGIALSDEIGLLAYPKTILHNNKKLLPEIKNICIDEEVSMIVLGESKNVLGDDNPIMNKIHEFAENCRIEIGLPVVFENESFTSFESSKRLGKEIKNARKNKIVKTENIDSKAAALILQRFLDKESD